MKRPLTLRWVIVLNAISIAIALMLCHLDRVLFA